MKKLLFLVCAAALLAGCRFREPEPSETVYEAAVAKVPTRPSDHLTIERGPSAGADGVQLAGVAFRAPADLVFAEGEDWLGACAGVCRRAAPSGVVFPCTASDSERVSKLLAAAKAKRKRGEEVRHEPVRDRAARGTVSCPPAPALTLNA